jgi:hypothetical protein
MKPDVKLVLPVLLGCALGAAPVLIADDPDARLAASLIVLAASTSIILARSLWHRDAFSPLAITAVFYLLAYGAGAIYTLWLQPHLPSAYSGRVRLNLTADDMTLAVVAATVAWLLFALGYYARPFRAVLRIAPPVGAISRAPSPVATVTVILALGWLARLVLISTGRYFHSTTEVVVSNGSSWTIATVSLLPALATALCGAYGYLSDGPARSRFRVAFFVLLVIELAWAIPTAERGQVVGLLLMAAVIRYYGLGRGMPLRWVAIGAVFVIFVVFPFGLAYRSAGSGYESDPATALRSAANKTFSQSPTQMLSSGLSTTFSRFSDAVSLSAIFNIGSDAYERAPGETLKWSVEGFVPRAIYPQRGDPGQFGNEFGRSFGIVPPNNRSTSISATQPGEMYLNFGWLGIVLVMPFVGGAYRLLGDYFAGRGRDPVVLGFYGVLAWPIASSQETIVANGLTGIFKSVIALGLILAIISRAPSWLTSRRARGLALPAR